MSALKLQAKTPMARADSVNVFQDLNVEWDPGTLWLRIGPLKNLDRVVEKALQRAAEMSKTEQIETFPHVGRVTDILRATVCAHHNYPEDLIAAFEIFKKRFKIVRMKNKFKKS